METQCRDEMPIKPGMLMRLRLNRGLERTQIPVELIWYNPSSLFCFQMFNNISIKISRRRIKTKKSPNMFDLGIWLKKLYTGSQLGNLGFIVHVHVRLKENFVDVWRVFDVCVSSEVSCHVCVMVFHNLNITLLWIPQPCEINVQSMWNLWCKWMCVYTCKYIYIYR